MYSTTSVFKQNNPNCKCRIYSIIRRSARVFESKTFAYIVYKKTVQWSRLQLFTVQKVTLTLKKNTNATQASNGAV